VARILLLHTNRSYAEQLAEVTSQTTPHQVEAVSRVPVSERLRVLARQNYDLIQADELIVNGMLATGASTLFDIPLVVAIRGWADYTNAHDQYGWLRAASIRARSRLALKRASETLFISEATKQAFTEQYPVSQYSVVGRPIDIDSYANGTSNDQETFNLLTATNLRYEKKFDGVLAVLRALPPLFEKYPQLRYRIAGAGKYLKNLDEFLIDYEYSARVDVLGFVDAIENEYASADTFVYISFLDAYPTVVLEAQAAGLPVVGGDAVGVPEAIGDAGAVCPPTPEGIREVLRRVLDDREYRRKLARSSRKKMETHNEESTTAHVAAWERALDREGSIAVTPDSQDHAIAGELLHPSRHPRTGY